VPQEQSDVGEGVEGGEVGGVAGGIVGGVVDQQDAPRAPVEFQESQMAAPVKVSGPDPQYTQKALDREVQGLMIVKCVVNVEGQVYDCRVLKSLPFMDRAVVEALEKRRYKPATLGGKPIAVDYTFRIKLTLPP
jgi:periplasmic protein TonB